MTTAIRLMRVEDLPAVFAVRTSTRENTITSARLSALGITEPSMAAALVGSHQGWVAIAETELVGFSMVDGNTGEMMGQAVLSNLEGLASSVALMNTTEYLILRPGLWSHLALHQTQCKASH